METPAPSDPLLFLQHLFSYCLPCVAMLARPTGQARSFPYLRGLVNTTLSKLSFMASLSAHHSVASGWVQSLERDLSGAPY